MVACSAESNQKQRKTGLQGSSSDHPGDREGERESETITHEETTVTEPCFYVAGNQRLTTIATFM